MILLETLIRLLNNKSFCCNAKLEEHINDKLYCSKCKKEDEAKI